MYGPDLMAAQRDFRAIWDPRERMNPGKVLDAYPITANLRVGPSYRPPDVKGLFAYPEDDGSFTKATLRCVGVGKCRRRDPKDGVMCPSYLGTGEEKHSTRGRARLLFEMLRGDALPGGFASDEVEDALNLCLACKGCKHDCPVQVDMAAYKSEFRARHYARKLRPRAAYAMGQIQLWARLASRAPWLANLGTRTPGIGNLAKWIGGIAQKRAVPRFASQTYRTWHASLPHASEGERVLLWPDTFNNFFRPSTAIAATLVLQKMGLRVDIPPVLLCCGRPLYDWGWIEQAKALWRRTLNVLQRDIEAGVTLIGLEPACVSAFRDELPALFPHDPLAEALAKQTVMLSDFLQKRGYTPTFPAESPANAVVQFHCHHHAVLGTQCEKDLLRRFPAATEFLRTGCCGMAGSFGFEAEKYDLSMRIGERGLFPRLREAGEQTLILADGFSCREQIEQATGRKTLHIAELLQRYAS
jgi:Fe-S oxidoreductase